MSTHKVQILITYTIIHRHIYDSVVRSLRVHSLHQAIGRVECPLLPNPKASPMYVYHYLRRLTLVPKWLNWRNDI